MKPVVGRALLIVALLAAGFVWSAPPAHAQNTLNVTLFEDPFVCDTIVRPLGTVSGLAPGEAVEFSSPQLNGVFSRRTADAAGVVEMRWNCDAPRSWSVSVRGLSSGGSASFTVTGEAAPPPPDAPIGAAFDARSAMTAEQMAIWKDFSPFSTVGVYIDVNTDWDNRADKIQRNLTPTWVSQIFADGWQLIPIYVGRQAPDQCATGRFEGLSLDIGTARAQGLESAADAVRSMTALGIGPGNPIYYDMEAYRPGCSEAVITFLDAWTEGVQASGYLSGVYGSRSSTMFDLSRSLGRAGFDAPDAVWVSTGNGRAESFGLEVPNDSQWSNARMHQYRLSVTRTYGGVTREIDENIVNAPLAGPNNSPVATAVPGGTDTDGDGIAEPEPDNCDNVANPDQADLDNDGDGDVCDRDIDGDGVDNVSDFAPSDPTITSAPAPTAEPTPTIVDTDGDGIAEPEPDNCDRIANPDQADLDNDGDGDVCDSDIDGDGVPNDVDQEARDPFIGAAPTVEPTVEPTVAPTVEPTAVPPAATAVPEPTATPATAPEPVTPEPVTPEPDTADEADTDPQVIVLPTALPTPLTTPVATPLPTAEAAAAINDTAPEPTTIPDADTTGSQELASDTVTITVEDDTPLLPYAIAALGLFSLFCIGMGVRSFNRNRPSGRVL